MSTENEISKPLMGRLTRDDRDEAARLVRETVEKLRQSRELLEGLGEDDVGRAQRRLAELEEMLETALRRLNGELLDREES